MSYVEVTHKEGLIHTIPSGNTATDSSYIFQILCLVMHRKDLLPSLGPGEMMPPFVDEQPEASKVKELAFDVKADSGRAGALIKVCLLHPRT